MGKQSAAAVERLEARVQRERLARARAEGVAEGMERVLRWLLTPGPEKARRARRSSNSAAPRPSKARSSPATRRVRKAAPARRARTRKAATARATVLPQRARPRVRAPRVRVAPVPPPAPLPADDASRAELLRGTHATALEAALVRVHLAARASPAEKKASGEVVARMRPWVVGLAKQRLPEARRVGVRRDELVQEGLVAVHDCCRRFTPGRAGAGRTLFPAYALRAARQAMGRLLQERRSVVPLTSWGQKVRRKAMRRVAASGMPLREALETEGASPSTVAALERGVVEVVSLDGPRGPEDPHELSLQDHGGTRSPEEGRLATISSSGRLAQASRATFREQEEHREQLALGAEAMEALSQLPEPQRLAVAGPLGLEGPAMPLPTLARRMGLSVGQVEQLRAEGLAALRHVIEA